VFEHLLCYNCDMRKLYYATFEKGWEEVVKSIIKKQDKNSQVKKLYSDAVLFFAEDHFKFENGPFKSFFLVVDNIQKDGVGALNAEMKHLLEKQSLKIVFPKDVTTFKLTYQKENENVIVDANLKNAVEIMLKKSTKKSISYLSTQAELVFLAKADGNILFMKRLSISNEFSKIQNRYEISPQEAYMLSFLSEPNQSEVVLDPFAGKGMVAYTRTLCFKKANVIANDENEGNVQEIKKKAKTIKDKSLSVLNYEFLSDKFPIRFIDKIVTDMTDLAYERSFRANEFYTEFFEKVYASKVKILVLAVSKSHDLSRFIEDKYQVEKQVFAAKYNVYKLKLI